MADLTGNPIRTHQDADLRRGALALSALVAHAIAAGTAKVRVMTGEDAAIYDMRAAGISAAEIKARMSRGGNSAIARELRSHRKKAAG